MASVTRLQQEANEVAIILLFIQKTQFSFKQLMDPGITEAKKGVKLIISLSSLELIFSCFILWLFTLWDSLGYSTQLKTDVLTG